MATRAKEVRERLSKHASESVKKRANLARNRQRSKTMVPLLDEHDRWVSAKERLALKGFGSDRKMAKYLLDIWDNQKEQQQQGKDEEIQTHIHPKELHETTIPYGLTPAKRKAPTTMSTPAVSMNIEKDFVSDISSIAGSVHKHGEEKMSGFETIGEQSDDSSPGSDIELTFDVDPNQYRDPNDISWVPDEEDLEDYIFETGLVFDKKIDFNKLQTQDEQLLEEELQANIHDDLEFLEESNESITESVNVSKARKIIDEPNQLITQTCGLAYEEKLIELSTLQLPDKCKHCASTIIHKVKKRGTCVVINWVCSGTAGHKIYSWNSQPTVRNMNAGDFMVSQLIPLSGNNYEKIKHFFTLLGMGCVNMSTFYKVQHFYVFPEVEKFWKKLKEETVAKHLESENLIIIGDGRNDSPGHSAQYCSYTMMEHDSHDILDQKIVDKREVDFKSPNMERLGLERCLKDLKEHGLKVKEVVTDAHVQIGSMMRKQHPDKKHSLDTWHGGKLYGKALKEAGSRKPTMDLLPWCKYFVNHFWHSSKLANGKAINIEKGLRESLKHSTNQHSWPGGHCKGHVKLQVVNHVEVRTGLDHPEKPGRPYLKIGSQAAKAVEKCQRNGNFMKKFPKYANYRHTGSLESFHNVILMYASKRQSYRYEGYVARNQLAIIDWQFHKGREQKTTKDGELLFHKQYNKNSNTWCAQPTKVPKGFQYMPELISNVLQVRLNDTEPLRRKL